MNQQVIVNDEIVITDPETLKVVADPLRLRILKLLKQPTTVKEVAEAVDIPPTKLYYHFSQLEKHELIQVVETRVVSGIIEKHYQTAARRFRVDESLFATKQEAVEHIDTILSAIFDNAKREVKQSIEAGLMQIGKEAPCEEGTFFQANICPAPEQLTSFCERLMPLLEECDSWDCAAEGTSYQPYGLMVALRP